MDGYTRLAALMATQKEYSIFRRFQSIRTLRLLYLSAEISHLSDELSVVVEADRESDDPEKQMYETYYAQQMKSRSNTQAHLWHELDAKLRDYGDLLLQHHRLTALPRATPRQHRKLTEWLHDKRGGHGFLRGVEAAVWDDEWAADLSSLQPPAADLLTRLIDKIAIPLYHRTVGHRRQQHVYISNPYTGQERMQMPLHSYSDTRIARFAETVSSMLASLMPALGTLGLSFVPGERARLGLVVGLTCLFSLALILVTNARRIDMFVATSAFAAVLGVFVGNDCSGSSCGSS
ncbi:uncharacterized protein HMPREF1541_01341 [Cyphellophora europaea CBS 101466]|uniref:DUF6594 domain-containing protein n=1 Tax=Cyphellophora europaea (strain CBS 101466) TaxID=1220924 RepID=W2SET8_CYPE1|nr:uncharacterized protein HMPREF1541_01341 [Cyphellophora europaea CBS 101466]ETN47150.1 hypothetical protein HMPREF1541_01341 [Cyphellophora europaea CBS 101466]